MSAFRALSLVPWVLLAAAAQQEASQPSGTLLPSQGSPFLASSYPVSIAFGEFNSDGKPDLAIAEDYSSSVVVLLGDGKGGFTPAAGSPFPVGFGTLSIVAGDFDRDGNLDLATAAYDTGVTVLLGDGKGGFRDAPGSPFDPLGAPNSLVVGDFNRDGKLDLAACANEGSSVVVLLGDGAGGFTISPQGPILAPKNPLSIAAGDFNGDGFTDIATAGATTNNVTVLLGDGTGSFTHAPLSPFAVGSNPLSLAVADLNGDGHLDMAVANDKDNNVTVLLGDGSGGFQPAAGSPFTVNANPFSVALADLNGDGFIDLVGASYTQNTLTVLLGDGSGSFTGTPRIYDVGTQPTFVGVGDVNTDGRLDVFSANAGSEDVSVLLGSVTPTSAKLTTKADPVIPVGHPIPLILEVIPLARALDKPTGSVVLFDNGVLLGSASETTSPYTFVYHDAQVGAHRFQASYKGDSRSSPSNSNLIAITVTP